jgi:hypothetical protein
LAESRRSGEENGEAGGGEKAKGHRWGSLLKAKT